MTKFISVQNLKAILAEIGIEETLRRLTEQIEADFARWTEFDKSPRLACHSEIGVIELMPIADDNRFAFKYVNGHPDNAKSGRQTVVAFGALASVENGYPIMLSEMTLLTALRTAATSAMAAKHLARPDSRKMAIIGNGAQAEFQALAFRSLLNIQSISLYDIDACATQKCIRNLEAFNMEVFACGSAEEAVAGADIVTTVTADKTYATILTDNLVGEGIHINGVGGDCPGKTEIHKDILLRSKIFVEYEPQTRIEGDIQQLPPDHPVTELWRVINGDASGRDTPSQITFFDSVGFALEDYSALMVIHQLSEDLGISSELELIAEPEDPKDLFSYLTAAQAR